MDKSLVLIKPDGTRRNLTGAIIARFESAGLRLVGLKMLHMDRQLAERHYDIHKGKPFFRELVDYITSGPIVAAVVQGDRVVERARKLMGATDPAKAEPGTIRADFGLNIQENTVHGSDAPATAEREIRLFFSDKELLD